MHIQPCCVCPDLLQNNPPRKVGACCDGQYRCQSNVDQDACDSSGGTWSSNPDACRSTMFCSGACCTGANTAAATCTITKKDQCNSGMFGGGSWNPSGDCNDPSFCPRVRDQPAQLHIGLRLGTSTARLGTDPCFCDKCVHVPCRTYAATHSGPHQM
jgi:hypothetical protein